LCLAVTVAGLWDGAGRKRVSGIRATRPALLKRRPENRPRRDHGGVGRGGCTVDRAAERTPVACKRRRQLSTMVPLPGRVVASRVWGQRIRTALELRALEQAKRRDLDVLAGRLWRAMAIGQARQDWPGLVQRVVAVDAGRLHARLRGIVGRIGVALDLRHPTGDQRSRHALRARGHQAASGDMHESRIPLLPSADRLVRPSRRSGREMCRGDVPRGPPPSGELRERRPRLSPTAVVRHLPPAHRVRCPLPARDAMHPWGLLQEEGEGGGLSGGQRLGEAGDHTLRRLPACLAHALVQHAGARRPEAVCWQSMPACTEHRDGVTAEHRRWPRLRRPVLSCLGPTGPVMGEREDHAWLWYAGPLGRCRVRPWDMRTGAFREIPRGLGPRVWAEDTNHRAGVNVATRSEAIEARRDGVEGRQRR
jgi:hypothetical protein